jgi:hypothetical protein
MFNRTTNEAIAKGTTKIRYLIDCKDIIISSINFEFFEARK